MFDLFSVRIVTVATCRQPDEHGVGFQLHEVELLPGGDESHQRCSKHNRARSPTSASAATQMSHHRPNSYRPLDLSNSAASLVDVDNACGTRRREGSSL